MNVLCGMNRNTEAFFALVRAGLWESEIQLQPLGPIDYSDIYRLAEEQSVIGLVAAGFEHVVDIKPPKIVVLQFVGQTLQLEQRNTAMNYFIGVLVDKMKDAGIHTLLVKGQGIAQCYERPNWRSCGDVDFFLDSENYEKAKAFLVPMATSVENEGEYKKHLAITIEPWVVELHGNLRCGLSYKMDEVIDEIQKDVFFGSDVRSWMSGETPVFLPGADSDVLFVFTHFLTHFYQEGLGLRQICDWCRLLWTYRESLKYNLLESRIREMGLMSEWKVFGAFAVDYLGMPAETMPFYSSETKWKNKAKLVCKFVMEVGNMGHNRDSSYFDKPYLVRKMYSFGRRCGDLLHHARIFPMDSFKFLPSIVIQGVKSVVNGE